MSFALGINTATWSVDTVAGPVVGDFLIAIDCRLVFYVNVTIAMVAIGTVLRRVPARPKSE